MRIGWDDFEIALLIEYTVALKNGTVGRQDGAKELSERLRQYALNRGIEIDDKFRNVNGMLLQSQRIKTCLFGDDSNALGSSKDFIRVCEIYKNNRSEFDELLKEAKHIILGEEIMSKQEIRKAEFRAFADPKNKAPQSVDNFLSAMDFASKYCKGYGYTKESLWELDDPDEIEKAIDDLYKLKLFMVCYKKEKDLLDRYFRFYRGYLNSKKYATKPTATNNTVTEKKTFSADDFFAILEKNNIPFELDNNSDVRIKQKQIPQKILDELKQKFPKNTVNATLIRGNLTYVFPVTSMALKNSKPASKPAKQLTVQEVVEPVMNTEPVNKDEYYEKKSPLLFRTLQSASRIYDDPEGFTTQEIFSRIGHLCSEDVLIDILDNVSFAKKLGDRRYTFSQKVIQASSKPATDTSHVEQIKSYTYDTATGISEEEKSRYIKVLNTRFKGGMSFDSIDIDTFNTKYEELFNEKINVDRNKLRLCGFFYKDRIYAAESVIDADTSKKLFDYIDSSFDIGKTIISYKSLLEDRSDMLSSCYNLENEIMLREYLKFTAEGKYYFRDDIMSRDKYVKVDYETELLEYLLGVGKPMTEDEIHKALPHISKDALKSYIKNNSAICKDNKEAYFHIDIFEFDEDMRKAVCDILDEMIEEDGYAVRRPLYKRIEKDLPGLIANNTKLSETGIFNCLASKLSEKYTFSQAVITLGEEISANDIYRMYARKHVPLKLDEMAQLHGELGNVGSYVCIVDTVVRINQDTFVSPNDIYFDVTATDKAIAEFMTGDCIPISEITSFISFPNVGYEWNCYLLMSYVIHFSKKFDFYTFNYSLAACPGIIVRKKSGIGSFVEAVAFVLANSNIELTQKTALNYLCSIGILLNEKYQHISKSVDKAKEIRRRRGDY